MELTTNINMVAVLAGAVSNMMLGMFWYSQMGFGAMWMKLGNMKPKNKEEEEMMKKSAGPAMVMATVTSLITAYVMAHFAAYFGLETPMEGAQLGFWLWLGFTGATGLSDHMFTKNPLQLFVINTGYRLVALLAMGAIIVALM
ncbi:DUF1761 domain-containing protein [Candidatus Woesebacteria bacterium]|nr:DUF1761 domain-containing protein [Candidatus Woesebacteria bacterium]